MPRGAADIEFADIVAQMPNVLQRRGNATDRRAARFLEGLRIDQVLDLFQQEIGDEAIGTWLIRQYFKIVKDEASTPSHQMTALEHIKSLLFACGLQHSKVSAGLRKAGAGVVAPGNGSPLAEALGYGDKSGDE